ncbi:MAG: tRNA (adenosine(37)-N6)-dimethylallyltransferase MiaA [Desulfatiglandaceae bacterium]
MAARAKIIVIAGPTASGKTELAVALGGAIGGEVVNADSMQVYRGMDIGTAKPSGRDRAKVAHHMLDVVDPDQDFNAADYRRMAVPVVEDIARRGRTALVVGGTGLYIKALTEGIFDCPPSDPELRAELIARYEELGPEAFHSLLGELDPETARRIHPNDRVRVTRAFEIIYLTGQSPSRLADAHRFEDRLFHVLYLCLELDRSELYQRIDLRSCKMVESGLMEETSTLLAAGFSPELKAMKGLGYRHMIDYLMGVRTLGEALETLQRDTRRYAKRQMTWFRKVPGAIWVAPDDFDRILYEVRGHLALRSI